MKRDYIYPLLVFVAAILCSVGCSRIEEKLDFDPEKGNNVLEGTFEGSGKTKTTLSGLENGVYKALWSSGDQIAVYIDGKSDGANYKLISGEDSPVASFSGYGKGESYVALYPAEMAKELQGSELMIELPAEQVYQANSFGVDSYPMLAVSNSNSLEFKNTCAILGVSMTGNYNIKSIEFRTNNEDVYVSGDAKIDITKISEPMVVMESGASNVVTLQCNGASLHQQNAKDFYLVLPAQIYKGGFTLTIYTSTGKMVKTVSEDVELKRSRIRKLKTFECKLDEGIEPSKTLAGEGTESSPFLVQSLKDLLLMQGAVNSVDGIIIPENSSAGVDAKTAHYKLTSDLSLSAVCGESGENWTPIGNCSENEDFVFRGVFDGDGYTISDLYISSDCAYQGLFGAVGYYGSVKNLKVFGNVVGSEICGIICAIAYRRSNFINCISNGFVKSNDMYAGGILGEAQQANIYDCINNAVVSGESNCVAGIVGSLLSGTIMNCVNNGPINGKGYHTGGISGYSVGLIYNCFNSGNVVGDNRVGGLVGYLSPTTASFIYNCYNMADVSGNGDYIGGVIGYIGQNGVAKNCVNVGSVTSKSNKAYVGSLCGCNESEITNCYWLYDDSNGINTGIGGTAEETKSENCFSLTVDQMKGIADAFEILYTAADGATYSNIIDALNGWAFDNTTDDMLLYGWIRGTGDGYPVFTGEVAEKPSGSTTPIFELYENEFEVPGRGGEITVELKATMNYYISSMPSWIKEVTPEGANDASIMKKHIFKAEENPEYVDRQGVIVFCNESQQCIPVTVKQAGAEAEEDDMSWVNKEFYHRSLAMRFTADWCGYCPAVAANMAEFESLYPDKVEMVHMHCDGNLKFSGAQPLMNLCNIEGYPTGIFDMRGDFYSTSSIKDQLDKTEQNYPTQTGVSYTSTLNGNNLELNLKIYAKAADNYKITVLLLEDNIVGYQADYDNGTRYDYVHSGVVRMALTNILGDDCTTNQENQIVNKSYNISIPTKYKTENMRVLVYVQRPYGSQMLVDWRSYGDYYVDNCVSGKLGSNLILAVINDSSSNDNEDVVPGEEFDF